MRIAALLLAAACAKSTPRAPDYGPISTRPAPAQAALYADCLAEAIAQRRYAHASDPSTNLLVFTCTGEAARAFYDGLADYSARIGSQFEHAGRSVRSTAKVHQDLFGVDYCATDGATHECVITLNVGDFMR